MTGAGPPLRMTGSFATTHGHAVTVHCTVTCQMTHRAGYLREFVSFWEKQPEVRKIWISLYTPQIGESSPEILPLDVRERVINELFALESVSEKLELPAGLLQAYRRPPSDPGRCVFTLTTRATSADLRTAVNPCQLGGKPDCRQCGCIASAAMEAISRHRLPMGIPIGMIYGVSRSLGLHLKALRDAGSGGASRAGRASVPVRMIYPLCKVHLLQSVVQGKRLRRCAASAQGAASALGCVAASVCAKRNAD